jgi:hypothetical protein
MPGIGDEMEGAMQHAPQPERQDKEEFMRDEWRKTACAFYRHPAPRPRFRRGFGTISPHHLVECRFSNSSYRVDK